mmetsp:Transcript_33930/g.106371  ORF Transcript_33930/g.106371 Transcript_33930/m.106371 type:complete len:94 (+) Transcript_33930:725-1006(+)
MYQPQEMVALREPVTKCGSQLVESDNTPAPLLSLLRLLLRIYFYSACFLFSVRVHSDIRVASHFFLASSILLSDRSLLFSRTLSSLPRSHSVL